MIAAILYIMSVITFVAGLAIGFLAGIRFSWWGDLKFWLVFSNESAAPDRPTTSTTDVG